MFSQHYGDHLNSNNPSDCDLWHNELGFKFRLPTIFYLVQFLHLVVHCLLGFVATLIQLRCKVVAINDSPCKLISPYQPGIVNIDGFLSFFLIYYELWNFLK